MSTHWAEDNLLVIRSLMERSAVYRRALVPILITLGLIGSLAALGGFVLELGRPLQFIVFWSVVGVVGGIVALLLARRQALKDQEPFWSPPTRRVALALAPALLVGACLSVGQTNLQTLIVLWLAFYGCGLHAAAFFTPRSIRWLGWLFLAGATLLSLAGERLGVWNPHLVMGLFFGGGHLAFGLYLAVSRKATNGL